MERIEQETELRGPVQNLDSNLAMIVAEPLAGGEGEGGMEVRGLLPRSMCTARLWSTLREGKECQLQTALVDPAGEGVVFAPTGWRPRYQRSHGISGAHAEITLSPVERSLLRGHFPCDQCGGQNSESVTDLLTIIGIDGRRTEFFVGACGQCGDSAFLKQGWQVVCDYLENLATATPSLVQRVKLVFGDA